MLIEIVRCEDLTGRIAWNSDRILRSCGLVLLWFLVRWSNTSHLGRLYALAGDQQCWSSPVELQRWATTNGHSSVYVVLTPFWKSVYVGQVAARAPEARWLEHIRGVNRPTAPPDGTKYRVMARRARACSWWMLPLVNFSGVTDSLRPRLSNYDYGKITLR